MLVVAEADHAAIPLAQREDLKQQQQQQEGQQGGDAMQTDQQDGAVPAGGWPVVSGLGQLLVRVLPLQGGKHPCTAAGTPCCVSRQPAVSSLHCHASNARPAPMRTPRLTRPRPPTPLQARSCLRSRLRERTSGARLRASRASGPPACGEQAAVGRCCWCCSWGCLALKRPGRTGAHSCRLQLQRWHPCSSLLSMPPSHPAQDCGPGGAADHTLHRAG